MQIVCSVESLVDIEAPNQGVEAIASSGFSNIVLPMRLFYSNGGFENSSENPAGQNNILFLNQQSLQNRVSCLKKVCSSQGVKIPIVRMSPVPPWYNYDDSFDVTYHLCEQSIHIASDVSASMLITYLPIVSSDKCKIKQHRRQIYLRLAKMAIKKGIRLLLENQYYDFNGHWRREMNGDPEDYAREIDELNVAAGANVFAFCLDMGIGSLAGQDMQYFCKVLGKRLEAVVLCETIAGHNGKFFPFTVANNGNTQTDWLGMVRGLRSIEFDGALLMEAADSVAVYPYPLRTKVLPIMRGIAVFFRWQIYMERILNRYPRKILFGAGRMCRRYLHCYGSVHIPLFIVDNNPQLWGNRINGLEIKAPKALRELPSDCVVFICNIRYKEIEEQLSEMGITNKVMRFSDEYLPFYPLE